MVQVIKGTFLPLEHNKHELTAQRLARFDPSLGSAYRQCWESRFGTISDPGRSALYQMRQVYDHFFGLLAPDDEVRQSRKRRLKVKGRKDDVTRLERIEYAATKVKNRHKAKKLRALADHMLNVYNNLNYAHKRGQLSDDKVGSALNEMQTVIEQWLDAFEISPN